MASITKRLSDLEADLKRLQHKRSYIPILFVTEHPKSIYTELGGTVFDGEAALERFADEHGTKTIIVNDIGLKRGKNR